MKRAAFLDRDGVINRKAPEGQYITSWEDVEILPGVPDAIRLLMAAGFCVLAVSNQRCVAKGLLTVSELESIHKRMREELAKKDAIVSEIYYCPHEENPPCSCRKPAPGLLLTAAREHGIDLSGSWMIGDSDSDVRAGRHVGCRTVRIADGAPENNGADLTARSLIDAVHRILALES